MDENQIKFGIELPKELHRQVKIAVATRGLKMKEASEQAFTAWLEAVGDAAKSAHRASAAAQVAAPSRFGEISPEEETYVHWLLALLRQKKHTPSAEIALQAVRLAGTELVGAKPVSASRKQKAG